VRFGVFELVQPTGELRRDGASVNLQEQPLQVLRALIEEPGRIVTREELRQKIWPANTFVDFDHGINNAIKRLREALEDTAAAPRYIETLPRRGYRFVGKIERETPRMRALAVLPLVNLSPDAEQEYFAEGLTDALITTLAKIGQLRVVSRTSSMLYKSRNKPLREIARELAVDAFIEGTMLRAGPRVRITAQLIDVRNEEKLVWAENYERGLGDVLALQADVASAIAREVHVKLTPQETARLYHSHTVEPAAYEAYLKGRYHWIRRSREGHERAVQYFEQAILIDPEYAAAYSGLADAVSIMGLWGLLTPQEACGKAKELARTALEIDVSLAEAHTSLAWATFHYDWAFADSESEFERALELDPRSGAGHHWFGMALGMMGRYEEAYTEIRRAIRLDPHRSLMHFGMAFISWCGRRYDQAIDAAREALELDPYAAQAYVWLGLTYVAKSMFEPALDALQKAANLSGRAPVAVACLGEAYAAVGDEVQARRILEELTGQQHVTAYFVSRVWSALGIREEAFRWLEIGFEQRAEWMALLSVDPRFDALRDHPRFQELMRRLTKGQDLSRSLSFSATPAKVAV